MKKYWLYLIALGVVIVVLVLLIPGDTKTDWKETYSKEDKIPYGTYILYHQLKELFPGKPIETGSESLYTHLQEEDSADSSDLIIINDYFQPDEYEVSRLLDFVRAGNDVFIAANYLGTSLTDTLNLTTNYFASIGSLKNDTFTNVLVNPALHYTPQKLKGRGGKYFTGLDSSGATVLGTSNDGLPNFIRIGIGAGNIFINLCPAAFTNVNLVSSPADEYAYKSISYLPVRRVIWDEHYKGAARPQNESMLKYILENKSLRAAYYLLLFLALWYVLFAGKRRQRLIPVIKPLKNATVEFVETIGRLYYQGHDPGNLAEKKMTYFLEYLRTKHHVRTAQLEDKNTIQQMSRILDMSESEIVSLLSAYKLAAYAPEPGALLEFNNMIDKIYKKIKKR
jgi:hypothetical protein